MTDQEIMDTLSEIGNYIGSCAHNTAPNSKAYKKFYRWFSALEEVRLKIKEKGNLDSHTEEGCPQSGGWISVKDRMPDDEIFVLVCNDDGHMMVAKYESEVMRWEYKYINYDWDVWDDEEQGPVCWWMPLPEPPKGV